MDHPDYAYTPWPEERRQKLGLLHRRRFGAPDGFCTVYGLHVPVEHRDPVRYWAVWIARQHGVEGAREFVLSLSADDWAGVPKIRDLWLAKKQVARNAEAIRRLMWEAYHAN